MGKIDKILKQEYNNYRLSKKRNLKHKLDKRFSKALRDLNENGFSIVEDFYSKEECDNIVLDIDNIIKQYPNQIWRDNNESDLRIYGADALSSKIEKFRNNETLNQVLETYEGLQMTDGFILGARLTYQENNLGSGGGWHRDWAVRKQTKAILYLTDVEETNGPFQYLNKSHTSKSILKATLKGNLEFNQNRFTENEVAFIQKQSKNTVTTFTAKAGTLIFTDTRGIHRGMPIQTGNRYALTYYTWFGMGIPNHIKKLLIKK